MISHVFEAGGKDLVLETGGAVELFAKERARSVEVPLPLFDEGVGRKRAVVGLKPLLGSGYVSIQID